MSFYKTSTRFIKFLIFIILLPFILIRCSCGGNGIEKPKIYWRNYNYKDGLTNLVFESHREIHDSNSYHSKDFQLLPIEGGVICEDIVVKNENDSYIVFATTLGEGPFIYTTENDDGWHVVELPPGVSKEYFIGPRSVLIDDKGNIWVNNGCMILKSSNNGESWKIVIGNQDGYGNLTKMELSNGYIWVPDSSRGSIVRINSNTLDKKIYKLDDFAPETIFPSSGGRIFIRTGTGIKVSSDGCKSFSTFYYVKKEINNWPTNFLEVDGNIWFTIDGEIIECAPDGTVLWKSSDHNLPLVRKMVSKNGLIWGLNQDNGNYKLMKIDTRNSNYFEVIELDFGGLGDLYVDENDVIYITFPGMLGISHDYGQNWQYKALNFSAVSMLGGKDSHIWATLWGGGLARYLPSTEQWKSLGICDRFYAMYVHSKDEIYLGVADDFIKVMDGGNSVIIIDYDTTRKHKDLFSICEDSKGTIYILGITGDEASQNGEWELLLYKSYDYGETWEEPELIYSGNTGPGWARMVIDEKRETIWVASEVGLYKRNLQGFTWIKVNSIPMHDIFIDENGNIYTLGGDAFISILKVNESKWETINIQNSGVSYKSKIFVDRDGDFWATSPQGLYYSPNQGIFWIPFTKEDGLASNYVTSIFVEGTGEDKIIWVGTVAGASKGIFKDVLIHLTSVTIESDNPNPTRAKVGDTVILNFTASEELLELPVVTIAGQYADEVIDLGNNSYSATRVMQEGDPEGAVEFTIDYKDTAGRPGNQVTEITSGSNVIFDKTPPVLSDVTITSSNTDPTVANVGDTVTLSFTASEELSELPVVTIAAQYADEVVDLGNNNYSATRVMQEGDPEGIVEFTIDYSDLAGNAGTQVTNITSGSDVIFMKN